MERRRELSARYWFECQCLACIKNWQLLDALPKGQIISEGNCNVLNFPKNLQKIGQISSLASKPPIDLYLISEKSIWKNQNRRTGFLVYFELDFYARVACKSQFQNLFLQTKNPVRQT